MAQLTGGRNKAATQACRYRLPAERMAQVTRGWNKPPPCQQKSRDVGYVIGYVIGSLDHRNTDSSYGTHSSVSPGGRNKVATQACRYPVHGFLRNAMDQVTRGWNKSPPCEPKSRDVGCVIGSLDHRRLDHWITADNISYGKPSASPLSSPHHRRPSLRHRRLYLIPPPSVLAAHHLILPPRHRRPSDT